MEKSLKIGDIVTNKVEQSPCWTIIGKDGEEFTLGGGVGRYHLGGLSFRDKRVMHESPLSTHYIKIGSIAADLVDAM